MNRNRLTDWQLLAITESVRKNNMLDETSRRQLLDVLDNAEFLTVRGKRWHFCEITARHLLVNP